MPSSPTGAGTGAARRGRVRGLVLGAVVVGVVVLGGLALVAVPEPAGTAPVVRLPGTHGPGVRDLVGLAPAAVVVTAGWVVVLVRWRRVATTLGARRGLLSVVLWAMGVGATLLAVFTDAGGWWVPGLVLALGVQAWWAAVAVRGR